MQTTKLTYTIPQKVWKTWADVSSVQVGPSSKRGVNTWIAGSCFQTFYGAITQCFHSAIELLYEIFSETLLLKQHHLQYLRKLSLQITLYYLCQYLDQLIMMCSTMNALIRGLNSTHIICPSTDSKSLRSIIMYSWITKNFVDRLWHLLQNASFWLIARELLAALWMYGPFLYW